MKTILNQLYDGEICPAEQFIPQIKEYQDMRKKHLDSLPIEFSETFIYGFRLGAKMAIEIYNSEIENE